jgi:hypothetical protein
MSLAMDDAVLGDIDDLDELRACEFERALGCDVLRVAGDPEGVQVEFQVKFAREREKKTNGTGGVAVSAVRGKDAVADVPCVELDVWC